LINEYLKKPQLHQANRQQVARQECEFLDGKASERMAQVLAQIAPS